MTTIQVIKQILLLPFPIEINMNIKNIYKYDTLYISKYKPLKKQLIQHLQYYLWLNKKFNKKDKTNISIIKTIKEFDYYK